MKRKLFSMIGTAVLLCSLVGCPEPPSPYPPAGLSYFSFADTSTTALLERGRLRAERTDITDTTKVLASEWLTSPNAIGYDRTRNYGYIFQIKQLNGLITIGQNKIRIMPSDKRTIGWLEFQNSADAWVNPSQVRYNGKPVERLTITEPTNPSYLYILK